MGAFRNFPIFILLQCCWRDNWPDFAHLYSREWETNSTLNYEELLVNTAAIFLQKEWNQPRCVSRSCWIQEVQIWANLFELSPCTLWEGHSFLLIFWTPLNHTPLDMNHIMSVSKTNRKPSLSGLMNNHTLTVGTSSQQVMQADFWGFGDQLHSMLWMCIKHHFCDFEETCLMVFVKVLKGRLAYCFWETFCSHMTTQTCEAEGFMSLPSKSELHTHQSLEFFAISIAGAHVPTKSLLRTV